MATAKTASVTFNPQNQSLDAIHNLVSQIVGKAGCSHCGRLINLNFQFQGDPEPDLLRAGVISVHEEGF